MKNLYTLFLYLFLPVILIRLLVRGFKNPDYWHRWGERFGRISMDASAYVWIHAVSVGEARAAAPLIQSLLSERAQRIIVTTMTPTGMDEVKRLFGDSVTHRYAPYDYPGSVNRFLDAVQPGAVIIMETEIWPNIISACSSRGIPVMFANLRLSEKSFRKYKKVSGVMGTVLKKVSCFAVQSSLDSTHLQELGALPETIRVTATAALSLKCGFQPASTK